MNNEYDFYLMGMRYAKDQMFDLKKTAKMIGEKYGADAKMEFEAGICSLIPAYQEIEAPITRKQAEGATTKFADSHLINNSYLGGNGVRSKYDIPKTGKTR